MSLKYKWGFNNLTGQKILLGIQYNNPNPNPNLKKKLKQKLTCNKIYITPDSFSDTGDWTPNIGEQNIPNCTALGYYGCPTKDEIKNNMGKFMTYDYSNKSTTFNWTSDGSDGKFLTCQMKKGNVIFKK